MLFFIQCENTALDSHACRLSRSLVHPALRIMHRIHGAAKRRNAPVRDAEKKEDDMVSLGSDDGESGSDPDSWSDEKMAEYRHRRREETRRLPMGSRGLLGREALLTPAITPRTFFPGAAGRGRAKGQPAQ